MSRESVYVYTHVHDCELSWGSEAQAWGGWVYVNLIRYYLLLYQHHHYQH